LGDLSDLPTDLQAAQDLISNICGHQATDNSPRSGHAGNDCGVLAGALLSTLGRSRGNCLKDLRTPEPQAAPSPRSKLFGGSRWCMPSNAGSEGGADGAQASAGKQLCASALARFERGLGRLTGGPLGSRNSGGSPATVEGARSEDGGSEGGTPERRRMRKQGTPGRAG